LSIEVDNSNFVGTFIQSAGTTTVSSGYFTGVSSIAGNSILVLSDGVDIVSGYIDLWDTGILSITTSNNLIFDGQISGTEYTQIIKTSSGILTLANDNSGFKGLFIQSSGTTIVEGLSAFQPIFFTGISSITNGSILELGDYSVLEAGSQIELWGNGQLNIANKYTDRDSDKYRNG
jgi:hypothetical protein